MSAKDFLFITKKKTLRFASRYVRMLQPRLMKTTPQSGAQKAV